MLDVSNFKIVLMLTENLTKREGGIQKSFPIINNAEHPNQNLQCAIMLILNARSGRQVCFD